MDTIIPGAVDIQLEIISPVAFTAKAHVGEKQPVLIFDSDMADSIYASDWIVQQEQSSKPGNSGGR
jgi:hypothetical protein